MLYYYYSDKRPDLVMHIDAPYIIELNDPA